MVWQFITENRLIQRFTTHWLYILFAPLFGWVMSNFLTTPTISAIAIILLGYIVLIILLEVWIKSKICRWIKSEKYCYCIIYSGLLIVCILIALPFWNMLVYKCDRDNPYKQPLLTGNATIEVIISSEDKNIGTNHFNSWCYSGRILLVKEEELFLEMWVATVPGIHIERIENNQLRYTGELALHPNNKTTGKPISYLAKAKDALIFINEHIPQDSNVVSGNAILTLNSSVRIEIPIPPQTMKDNAIIIQDVQKYLRKGN